MQQNKALSGMITYLCISNRSEQFLARGSRENGCKKKRVNIKSASQIVIQNSPICQTFFRNTQVTLPEKLPLWVSSLIFSSFVSISLRAASKVPFNNWRTISGSAVLFISLVSLSSHFVSKFFWSSLSSFVSSLFSSFQRCRGHNAWSGRFVDQASKFFQLFFRILFEVFHFFIQILCKRVYPASLLKFSWHRRLENLDSPSDYSYKQPGAFCSLLKQVFGYSGPILMVWRHSRHI